MVQGWEHGSSWAHVCRIAVWLKSYKLREFASSSVKTYLEHSKVRASEVTAGAGQLCAIRCARTSVSLERM